MAEFHDFVYWGFLGFLSLLGSIGILLLKNGVKSINELNVKIAVVIERVRGHEGRIRKLENKK